MTELTDYRTTQPWIGTVDCIPRIENRRLEDHNNVVRSSTGTPWRYVPRPPFQFQTFHESGDPEYTGWLVRDMLADVVNDFARWALPPRQGFAAEIVDESFRQVLCGLWARGTAWDMGGAWFGCKAVFDEMRRQSVTDDVSLAMWEGQAMSTAPGSGFLE